MVCLDYLENESYSKDELMNKILVHLDEDFDAALFLLDNRHKIIETL